jgi:hypothetical protein
VFLKSLRVTARCFKSMCDLSQLCLKSLPFCCSLSSCFGHPKNLLFRLRGSSFRLRGSSFRLRGHLFGLCGVLRSAISFSSYRVSSLVGESDFVLKSGYSIQKRLLSLGFPTCEVVTPKWTVVVAHKLLGHLLSFPKLTGVAMGDIAVHVLKNNLCIDMR